VPQREEVVLGDVARERGNLIPTGGLAEPLSTAEFAKAAGFRRERAGRTELLVPAARFEREFPNHVTMMRQLRGAGLARTEGGEQPKLTIKVPSAICRTGRVHCVVIGPATASPRVV